VPQKQKIKKFTCIKSEVKVRTNSVAPEPEGSSPHSQQPANGPYPEPGESNPHPQPISLRSILIPSSHLCFGLSSGLFPLGFPTKTLYTFFHRIHHGLSLFRTLRNKLGVLRWGVVSPPNPKLEDHPLSAVRDCLFNI
jgi:hypothetical protein